MPLYLLYIRKLLKEAILTVLMTDLLDSMVQNRPSILFCFCKLKQSEICPSSIHYFVYECPGSAKTNDVKWDHDLKPHTSTLPESWRPDIRGQGSRGWAPCRGSRGGSFPPLPASGGSGRPSLGWWPPPSRLRLRLHVASPLRPCLPSCVSYKDLVAGFRATPTQEEPHLRPSLPHRKEANRMDWNEMKIRIMKESKIERKVTIRGHKPRIPRQGRKTRKA